MSAASYEARRLRHPLGDVDARGVPALPGCRLPARRRASLPGREPRRHGDPAALHAPGRADLDRRGVPRRHRVSRAVRRRPDDRSTDQGRDAGRGRADRIGRGRDDEARGQDRLGPAQARRAGRRAARGGGRLPGTAPDRAAVGRRREDGERPWRTTASGRSATSRRSRRTSSSAASASTGRRSSNALAGSIPTRCTMATRPSRSATSTRSTSTRATREVIERTLLAMADGVAGRLRSAGVKAGTIAVKIRDSGFRTITRQRTLAGADRPDRADLRRPRSTWLDRRSAG